MQATEPTIAVLVPLFDLRGDMERHLRTWTHGQTLERSRYQVVVASASADPATEERVAGLLAPQDRLERAPGLNEEALWTAAVAAASAPWMVLTEAHCEAEPGCLERLDRAVRSRPDLDAARLKSGHVIKNRSMSIQARWFEEVFAGWGQAEDFCRLSLIGTAIHRRVFVAAGGLEPRYSLFCTSALSARLHHMGANVGQIDDAVVKHVLNETVYEHHGLTRDEQHGEFVARSELDPGYCERYFGHSALWARRWAYRPEVARPVAAALVSATCHFRGRPGLGRLMAGWLSGAAGGVRPQLQAVRIALLIGERAIENLPMPEGARWSLFLRCQGLAAKEGRLRWLSEWRVASPGSGLPPGDFAIEDVEDHVLIGTHGLEAHREGQFRWIEPIACLRVAPADDRPEVVP